MKNYWLIIITLLGLVLRVNQLGTLPSILNRDEAAIAYNAYLLNSVGKDEWGRSWPIALESFGDFKLLGYPALLSLLFNFLPLEDWVVRLPSAFFGTLLIPATYYLSQKLKSNPSSSLLASFFIAINPVFVFYSRVAFEANVALFFVSIVVILLLTTKHNFLTLFLILSSSLFAIITYNTPLLLLPLLMLATILKHGVANTNLWIKKVILISIVLIVGIMILIPITNQKSGITIFSDETTWSNWIEYRNSLPLLIQPYMGHQYTYWLIISFKSLFFSFSPNFIVTNGGTHPWHSIPSAGNLLLTVYVLGIIGIIRSTSQLVYSFLKEKLQIFSTHSTQLIRLLLLVGSLFPSIITVDAPHTTRSLFFFVMFIFFAADSLVWINDKFASKYFFIFISFILIINSGFYLHNYFFKFPHQQSAWQPGFAEIINTSKNLDHTQEIAVIDGGGFQYILTAWYLKISPEKYFSTIVRQQPDKIGFKYGERLVNYHFIVQPQDRVNEQAMILWDGQVWKLEN